MQYFKITAFIEKDKENRNNDVEKKYKGLSELEKLWIEFCDVISKKLNEKGDLFLSGYARGYIEMALIVDKLIDVEGMFINNQKKMPCEMKDRKISETSFNTFRRLLSRADRDNYIKDEYDIIEKYGISVLAKKSDHYGSAFEYVESILKEHSKEVIYENANQIFSMKTFIPELNRIYIPASKKKVVGHPVNYIIRFEDYEIQREIKEILLSALYDNNRICNKRYCEIVLDPYDMNPWNLINELFQTNVGGTMFIRIPKQLDEDGEQANGNMRSIERICKYIKKYNNQVLIVFLLSSKCEVLEKFLQCNLGNMTFVEIEEDFVTKEEAKKYLKQLAQKNNVSVDKNLNKAINDDGYTGRELKEIFDEWYNRKLKKSIYPQYKDIASMKRIVAEETPRGSAYAELQELVGLEEAKKVMDQAIDYYKAKKLFADKGMNNNPITLHMVFTGNPGTAKTTVARLFAKILKENRILEQGHIVEVGRADLVGRYIGWTAQIIKEKFARAMGGVLFIDEAYSLVDDRNGSYGDEAINTIVQEMENHRHDVVVIFAGYPDKMEEFLDKNPGLRSRIAFYVPFYDYSADEMCEIASLISKESGVVLDEKSKIKLKAIFETAKQQPDFGNGRYVRNVIEKAKLSQASRLVKLDYQSVTEKDVMSIIEEDIEMPERTKSIKQQIGFALS